MTENKKYLEVAKSAALKAGEHLIKNFGIKHVAEFKSEHDIGLSVDRESESIILTILKEKYYDHNFYSEEFGKIENNSKFTWYIDPLDGTNNYFSGIPYFSVSIALLFENEIIVGVVYNPISKQLFEAIKGIGAFLNGNEIQPSQNTDFSKSVCSFIQGHGVSTSEKFLEESISFKKRLDQNFRRVISTWAPALDWALLAFGGIDALVSFESELEDMYAGLLIAKEAGVKIMNFDGDDFTIGNNRVLATNNYLKNNFCQILINERK